MARQEEWREDNLSDFIRYVLNSLLIIQMAIVTTQQHGSLKVPRMGEESDSVEHIETLKPMASMKSKVMEERE